MFVPVILAAYLMQSWTSFVDFGIGVSERTKYSTYATWISVAVCVALYWLLIPRWAGMGAAVATAVAMTVRMLLSYRFSQQLWHVAYDWRPQLRLLGWGAATIIPAFLVVPDGFVIQMAAGLGLTGVFALAAWHTVLTDEDRVLIRQLIRTPRELSRLIRGA